MIMLHIKNLNKSFGDKQVLKGLNLSVPEHSFFDSSARTENGLTQEELASKMMVSRQAITKWEANKGIPDVSNLKLLAQLLNVSVDYLLDDGVEIDINVIRETIDLSKYGKAVIKKKLTNKLMLDRYPDTETA